MTRTVEKKGEESKTKEMRSEQRGDSRNRTGYENT